MVKLKVGDLVAFHDMFGETVLGKVIKSKRYVPMTGDRVLVRISSRKATLYPFGLCYDFTPSSLWKREREVRAPKAESAQPIEA